MSGREKGSFSKNLRNMIYSWSNNNIFNDYWMDAVCYLFLYIFIPIVVTYFAMKVTENTTSGRVYFYTTVLISALNCLYDAFNRRRSGMKSVKNTKLILLSIPVIIAAGYCIIEILHVLIVGVKESYPDELLCIYFISAAIVVIDFLPTMLSKFVLVDESLIKELFQNK